MAQRLVHQHHRHHRLGDRGGTDADAGIVAAGGDHFHHVARGVQRRARQAQAGGWLQHDRSDHRLAGGNTARSEERRGGEGG
ncbi:hypothetical protein G6F62_015771 [Rhizopus arrhizus]|nr:hypothetical protein G6F62_015771 [Rhizopus arrhizus]